MGLLKGQTPRRKENHHGTVGHLADGRPADYGLPAPVYGCPLKRLWSGDRTVATTNINQGEKENFIDIVSFLRDRSQIKSSPQKAESHAYTVVLIYAHVHPATREHRQRAAVPDHGEGLRKVIQKYQTSSCQQLAEEKSQPPTGKKVERCNTWRSSAIELNDPERYRTIN